MRAVKRERKEPVIEAPAPRRRPGARAGRPFAQLGLKPERPFGRRGRGLRGRIASASLFLRRHGLRVFSFGAVTALLLVGLTAYGLVAAGYVQRWGEALAASFYAATAEAGFGIESVTLSGRERLSKEAVLAALGVSRGDPLLAFDAEAARARLIELDWVKEARVMRRLPGTIIVTVEEKQPLALWLIEGRAALIDRAGGVITARDIEAFKHLPVVVNASANLAAADLIDRLQQHPRIAREVAQAVFVSERRWDLHMKNGIVVMLPERAVTLGLVRLDRMILEDDILRRAVIAIDLRSTKRTYVSPMKDPLGGPGDAT